MAQPRWFPTNSPILDDGGRLTRPWVKFFQNQPVFVDNETPQGLIDGVNKAFTLMDAPNPVGSLLLANSTTGGALLLLAGVDFTLRGKTLSLALAPALGTALRAWYRTQ